MILYMSLNRFNPTQESALCEMGLASTEYHAACMRPCTEIEEEYYRACRSRLNLARDILWQCRTEARYGE